jgi:hypothetical protein
MKHVVKLKDPELVGEFLHSLKILGTPFEHPVFRQGVVYLLMAELPKDAKAGRWLKSNFSFFRKYHAAYCAIIGLSAWSFTTGVFDCSLNKHFEVTS